MFWSKARAALQRQFDKFLQRAIPSQKKVTLNHKKLFILPTKSGWFFLIGAMLIWLLGTNYENNLALALAYFLLSVFLIAIIHTFNNLHRLKISLVKATPGFCGDSTQICIRLNSSGAAHLGVAVGWVSNVDSVYDIDRNQELDTVINLPLSHRGWFNPGRLKVESTYPLGLWRCWSRLDLDVTVLSYPKPIVCDLMGSTALSSEESIEAIAKYGSEEFHSLREFQASDTPKQIAWKQYAQGRGLLSKNYLNYQLPKLELDWDVFTDVEGELRLSNLCYLALTASKNNQPFSLKLPGFQLPTNTGEEHLGQALQALAVHRIITPQGLNS